MEKELRAKKKRISYKNEHLLSHKWRIKSQDKKRNLCEITEANIQEIKVKLKKIIKKCLI